jgi:hypothetical protein
MAKHVDVGESDLHGHAVVEGMFGFGEQWFCHY